MTVKELIEKLKEFDEDLPVIWWDGEPFEDLWVQEYKEYGNVVIVNN